MIFRTVFLVLGIAIVGGSGYLSYHGIWRESTSIDKSVRTASAGARGGYIGGSRVK